MSEFEGFDQTVPRQGPKQIPGPNDEPPEEDEPAAWVPPPNDQGFIIQRNAFGPGAHSVKFADGTPVGVYINERDMTPEAVEEMLTTQGLDADLVDFFVRNRDKGRTAMEEILANPVVAAFAQEEKRHRDATAANQEAFLKAWKDREKKK